MQGPFEVEIKVRFASGENTAIATFSLPAGIYPTREAIDEAIAKSLAAAQGQLGDGIRLLTRREFQQEIIAERTGCTMEFACPEDWDA